MIRVTFKCGHGTDIADDLKDAPACPTCGERQIANVKAPPPKFRGVGAGPLMVKG